MNVSDLKTRVEKYRENLKKNSGKACLFSETGPVGMSLIDAIVEVLDAQQKRIDALQARLADR